MWRNRFTLASVVLFLVIVPSCGPDLGSIHLSECMKGCNTVAKQCLDDADKKLETCANDQACLLQAVKESESCLTTCLDCTSACVAETEKTLKQ